MKKSDFRDGQTWMRIWIGVLVFVTLQTIVMAVFGWLSSVIAVSIMSIEALYFAVFACFQSTLGMRKADPEDPM